MKQHMNSLSIPPILSSLLFLLLGGFVYFQNRKSSINFTFLLICITTFWWQFSWFFLFNTQSQALAEILVKIGYIGIILLPVTFLHFSLAFLGKIDKFNKTTLYLSYFLALLFEISLFTTNYFIDGYYKYFWGFYPKANFLHLFFLLFIAILLIRVIYLLLVSLKKEPKISLRRSQIEYILIAIIFYTFASSDFLINHGYEFYPLGFIPILFFLSTIGYAIVRYRLMNVKVILTELLVSVIAVVLFSQIFTSEANFDYIWKGALFLAFLILGYLLIRSVLDEIKRRLELEKLTLELKKAYAELEKLDKAKSEFISIASHQLRTPLTAIKGYISMMIEESYGKPPEKMRKPLENIYLSNERLIKLVNDLLSVSRIESGRIKIKLEKVSIDEIIVSLIEELKGLAREKDLYLKFEKPEKPLPEISVDEERIRQVILNLIENAIRYTNKGSITISAKKSDSKIQISIKDTGEGISKEEIPYLFESFSRGSAGTRFWTEGAGLGLYVAKKFVEMHNGKIWAESPGRGKGSTFYIELKIR